MKLKLAIIPPKNYYIVNKLDKYVTELDLLYYCITMGVD